MTRRAPLTCTSMRAGDVLTAWISAARPGVMPPAFHPVGAAVPVLVGPVTYLVRLRGALCAGKPLFEAGEERTVRLETERLQAVAATGHFLVPEVLVAERAQGLDGFTVEPRRDLLVGAAVDDEQGQRQGVGEQGPGALVGAEGLPDGKGSVDGDGCGEGVPVPHPHVPGRQSAHGHPGQDAPVRVGIERGPRPPQRCRKEVGARQVPARHPEPAAEEARDIEVVRALGGELRRRAEDGQAEPLPERGEVREYLFPAASGTVQDDEDARAPPAVRGTRTAMSVRRPWPSRSSTVPDQACRGRSSDDSSNSRSAVASIFRSRSPARTAARSGSRHSARASCGGIISGQPLL